MPDDSYNPHPAASLVSPGVGELNAGFREAVHDATSVAFTVWTAAQDSTSARR
jgi:hypothetical protein